MTKDVVILDFIKRRFSVDNNWCTGNCYWFAHILVTRFIRLKMYYLPIQNHFLAGDGKYFYDWHGAHTQKDFDEKICLWSDYKKEDLEHTKRILRDCLL